MQSIDRSSPLRLIQITDCHLGGRPGETLLGLNTDESFVDVLQNLSAQQANADLVIASGDITSDSALEAYERFLETTKHYFDRPLAWLAGNHDLDATMRQFPASDVQREYIELEHWQIILLDSSVAGSEHGDIAERELERLRTCLDRCDKHALIFVHHPAVLVGCDWIDQYVIHNADELLTLLSGYPQVKSLVCGHIHQDFHTQYRHFSLYATPSTCIQFKPNSAEFALDVTMPGYRWFDLFEDGRLETGVARIAEKAYGIDFASAGY